MESDFLGGLAPQPGLRARITDTVTRQQVSAVTSHKLALDDAHSAVSFMMDPYARPAPRVSTDSANYVAVCKSNFVQDLPSSGQWNSSTGITDPWVMGEKGFSQVYVFPGSAAAIWHTLGDELADANPTIPGESSLTPVPTYWAPWHIAANTTDGGASDAQQQFSRPFFSHTIHNPRTGAGIVPRLDSDGIPRYQMAMVAATDADVVGLKFGFNAISSTTGTSISHGNLQPNVTITTWNAAGVELDDLNIGNDLDPQGLILIEVPSTDDIANAGTPHYFALRAIESLEDQDIIWTFTFRGEIITDGMSANLAFLSIPAHSATAYAVMDIPEFTKLQQTSDEVTTGVDMLITYVGSTLFDGGEIAAARMPPNYSTNLVADGDMYRFLSRLPNENYDGPLKGGSHIAWLPKSEAELDSVPSPGARSRNLLNTGSLICAMSRDNNSQTVRLRVTAGLQFVTTSAAYEVAVSVPNKMIMVAVAHAMTLPAGTSNPSHRAAVTAGLGRIFSYLTNPANILKAGRSLFRIARG
jgi:hypothetical protein